MADNEKAEYRPERSQNILADDVRLGYPQDEIEHPGYPDDEVEQRQQGMESETSTFQEKHTLERTPTSATARERAFEPIHVGDREELHRIASEFGGSAALSRSNTRASSALQRSDTLAGVELGDPVLDPSSPDFDVYKWARM